VVIARPATAEKARRATPSPDSSARLCFRAARRLPCPSFVASPGNGIGLAARARETLPDSLGRTELCAEPGVSDRGHCFAACSHVHGSLGKRGVSVGRSRLRPSPSGPAFSATDRPALSSR
jgi:hypothetical protein